jgi:hypothetical protein
MSDRAPTEAELLERRSRGESVDMSPDAVLRRLRLVAELNRAVQRLATAQPVASPPKQLDSDGGS